MLDYSMNIFYLVGSLQIGKCYSALAMDIPSVFRLCAKLAGQGCSVVVIIVDNQANTHTELLATHLGVHVH